MTRACRTGRVQLKTTKGKCQGLEQTSFDEKYKLIMQWSGITEMKTS